MTSGDRGNRRGSAKHRAAHGRSDPEPRLRRDQGVGRRLQPTCLSQERKSALEAWGAVFALSQEPEVGVKWKVQRG